MVKLAVVRGVQVRSVQDVVTEGGEVEVRTLLCDMLPSLSIC